MSENPELSEIEKNAFSNLRHCRKCQKVEKENYTLKLKNTKIMSTEVDRLRFFKLLLGFTILNK